MMDASKVKDLDFSDCYLGLPGLDGRFSDVPGAEANPWPAGPSLRGDLDALHAACLEELAGSPAAAGFRIVHDGVAYRVTPMRTVGGTAFVLRKLARTVPALAELGLPPACLPSLAARNLSGLLLVCGAPKSGKTTTACAIVKERLRQHGGVAVTAEEPVELGLEGSHGQGICLQTVAPDGRLGIAESLRRLARSGAHTLLVGDIRDEETAAEVLAAGVDGRLVIATMAAESIVHAIVKLHGLASRKLPADAVSALIANGLAGVLHQRMVRGAKATQATQATLAADFLSVKDAPAVKSMLRGGQMDQLETDIRRQMAAWMNDGAASRRY